jgi:hypothetical protein
MIIFKKIEYIKGLNTLLPPRVSTFFFFPLGFHFYYVRYLWFFIKTKMVLPLKLYSKLNEMPRQHQSNVTTCHIINFFIKNYIYIFKKWGGRSHPLSHLRDGRPPPSS